MIDNRGLTRKKGALASLSLLLLTVLSIGTVTSGASSEDTLNSILPAYAVATVAKSILNSGVCRQELGVFKDAVDIRKLWGLRMLDSSGVPKPGFIYGNNYWLGGRYQCDDLTNKKPIPMRLDILQNATKYRKPEEEFPPYEINYFVARFRHNGTFQYQTKLPKQDQISLGLCLPASCTPVELSSILRKIFNNRTLIFTDLYQADFQLDIVKDLHNDWMRLLNPRMIIVAAVLAVTLLLMVVGTAYDVLVDQKYLTVKKKTNGDNYDNSQKLTMEMSDSVPRAGIKRPSFFGNILKCFSIYTNTKFIFNTKMGADAIGPINGLRFFTMTILVTLHTMYFTLDMMDNKPLVLRMTDELATQTVANGAITVNTFFVISGFLVVYLYFKQNPKGNTENEHVNHKAKIREFFVGLFKRFIRLTPAYMIVIAFEELLAIWYNNISIFDTLQDPEGACSKYWWRNLLYIHNFFHLDEMCASWTWYLANDMQYHVIGTFIVLLSSAYYYASATILIFILLSSTFVSGYISYVNDYVPTLDKVYDIGHLIYYPPWIRIGPYIVGMIAAYIFVRLNKKLELRRRNLVSLWVLASACGIFVLFGLYKRHISVTASAFYSAFSNTAWGVWIAWILIACCTNNGGFVNTFLSLRVWVPLGRLTYCAYLLNPIIIKAVSMYGETQVHFELVPSILVALGTIGATYMASYILSLMMETPYLHIIRLFTKPRIQH